MGLREYMKERKLTLRQLAEEAGMSYATVYGHVFGRRRMSAEAALKYYERLGIPLEELLVRQSTITPQPKTFKDTKLRRLMKASGLKTDEIAKKTGMDLSTVYRHLSGIRRIGLDAAIKYSELFGVTVQELVTDIGSDEPVDQTGT